MSDRCQELRPSLDLLVGGELAGGEAAEVERHLGACAACASLRDRLARTDARLRALPAPAPSPVEWQLLLARARRTAAPYGWRVLFAASLLLMAIPTTLAVVQRTHAPLAQGLDVMNPSLAPLSLE